MNAEQRAMRALRIRELVNNPDVKAAWEQIEADLTEEWRKSFTTEERENCWRAINVMDRLKTYLNSYQSADLTALRRQK